VPALTLLYPPAGPLGFNLIVSGSVTAGPFGPGDTVDAYLRRPGILNTVVRGTHVHGSGSNWSLRLQTHVDIGCNQGAPVDLTIEWHDAIGTLIDSQLITGVYTNDSITGIGPLALAAGGGGYPSILDDIYNALYRTFPAP
jgi:hypothetical protein